VLGRPASGCGVLPERGVGLRHDLRVSSRAASCSSGCRSSVPLHGIAGLPRQGSDTRHLQACFVTSALVTSLACRARRRRLAGQRTAQLGRRAQSTADAKEADAAELLQARLALVGTTACWATYPVIVKLLADLCGGPLDSSLITVIRFAMMAVLSLPLLPPEALRWETYASDGAAEEAQDGSEGLAQAALGTAGTLLNTWGIEHTATIRAALLLSTVNILTPLLSVLIGSPGDRSVSVRTWLGCILSFVATAYATVGQPSGELVGLAAGDIAVLCAAVCYAAVKVRLAARARAFPATILAAGRLIASAFISAVVFAVSVGVGSEDGWQDTVTQLVPDAWALLFFSALTSGLVATVLQARGQRLVPPAQAQTIYALVPLFAAGFDFLVLHEAIEDREIIAGVVIVLAASLS